MICPECGKRINPLEAWMEDEWVEVIKLLPSFDNNGRLVMEYCEKFGVSPLRIKGKKLLRLLKELSALFTQGKFRYQKREYGISVAGIVEALKVVNNKAFDNPLENHNYLKKVMIDIAGRERKQVRDTQDRAVREREKDRSRKSEVGSRKEKGTYREGLDAFKQSQGVESLADLVGKRM